MKLKIKATRDLTLALAKKVAETASKRKAETRILFRDKGANAKSLMGVIALSYKKGDELLLYAEGTDAERAIKEIKEYL